MRDVDAITWPDVDFQFGDSVSHITAIAKISQRKPVNAIQERRFRDDIAQLSEPCPKGDAAILLLILFNFEHRAIVTYILREYNSPSVLQI